MRLLFAMLQVLEAGPMPHVAADTSGVLCCNKATDSDRIPWAECAPWDVMRTNFTHQALVLQGRLERQGGSS